VESDQKHAWCHTLLAAAPKLSLQAKNLTPPNLAKVVWAYGRLARKAGQPCTSAWRQQDSSAAQLGLSTVLELLVNRLADAVLRLGAAAMAPQSCAMAAWGFAQVGFQNQVRVET
jgi:hypothetical protein